MPCQQTRPAGCGRQIASSLQGSELEGPASLGASSQDVRNGSKLGLRIQQHRGSSSTRPCSRLSVVLLGNAAGSLNRAVPRWQPASTEPAG